MQRTRLIHGLLGILLISAGLLKYHEMFSQDRSLITTVSAIIAGSECLFGLWLILGLYPRVSRCIALGVFVGLLHIALLKALENRASCGCFGKVPVRPWVAVGIDAVSVLLILVARPPILGEGETGFRSEQRPRWWAIGTGAAAVLVVSILLVISRSGSEPEVEGQAQQVASVSTAADKLAANYDTFPPLRLKTEVRYVNSDSVMIGGGKGGPSNTATPKMPARKSSEEPVLNMVKELRFDNTFLVAGNKIRRDSRASATQWHEVILQDGRDTFQYLPDKHRGWVRGSPFIEPHPLDPRCFGFDKPIASVADGVRDLRDARAEPVAGTAQLLIAGVNSSQKVVEIRLDQSRNCVPVEICYRHPDGSIRSVTTLTYQQVGTGFVLERGERREYNAGVTATAPNPNWRTTTTLSVSSVAAVSPAEAETAFQEIVPASTSIWNEATGGNVKLTAPASSSELFAMMNDDKAKRAQPRSAWPWPLLVGDVVLLVVCCMFRRHFRF